MASNIMNPQNGVWCVFRDITYLDRLFYRRDLAEEYRQSKEEKQQQFYTIEWRRID